MKKGMIIRFGQCEFEIQDIIDNKIKVKFTSGSKKNTTFDYKFFTYLTEVIIGKDGGDEFYQDYDDICPKHIRMSRLTDKSQTFFIEDLGSKYGYF